MTKLKKRIIQHKSLISLADDLTLDEMEEVNGNKSKRDKG